MQCGKCLSTLPFVNILINATPQLCIGKMPYEIVHGYKLSLPIDITVPVKTPAIDDYLLELYKL